MTLVDDPGDDVVVDPDPDGLGDPALPELELLPDGLGALDDDPGDDVVVDPGDDVVVDPGDDVVVDPDPDGLGDPALPELELLPDGLGALTMIQVMTSLLIQVMTSLLIQMTSLLIQIPMDSATQNYQNC